MTADLSQALDAFSRDYAHGDRIEEHSHDSDQLLYAASGAMSVTTEDGAWVIPHQRGVWIPAGVRHRIMMSGPVRMRTLYLPSGRFLPAVDTCRVLTISPLHRELLLEVVRTPESARDVAWHALVRLLLQRLAMLPVAPLHLPVPRDPRAKRAAEAILERPDTRESLAELSRRSGASPRTLSRLFLREAGMTPGQWRQQARLLAGLRLLALGRSVSEVALEVGYETPSAFIAMFRRALGVSPGRYYSRGEIR